MNIKLEPTKGGYKIFVRIKRKGKTFKRTEYYSGTKRAAERRGEAIRITLEERAENRINASSLKTFSQCIDFYLERSDNKYKPNSLLERLRENLGHLNILELESHFFQFIASLNDYRNTKGALLSESTINRHISYTQSVFKCCVDWRFIEESPLKKVPPRFKEKPREVDFSEEQETTLLETTKEIAPHLLPIVMFALEVPARKGELTKLKMEDVNVFRKRIRIRGDNAKNGQDNTKPIPPALLPYFANVPAECEYAFYRIVKGKYYPLGDFHKSWYKVRERAGLPELRFHDLRHIAITKLVNLNTPERQIQDVANWKTNMVPRYYNRNAEKSASDVFQRLDEAKSQSVIKDYSPVPLSVPL